MKKERKHYTAEEKVAILRRHLLDKVAVSDLCEELALQPTVRGRRSGAGKLLLRLVAGALP
jgi:transposase-like protein